MKNALICPSFDVTKQEHELIAKIADRAVKITGKKADRMTIQMDITACHANGCKLDLEKLLAFDDANFGHDVFGINRYLDRDTGELTDCFLPRCSA